MACEHDGNCFSGCCSIFVGDSESGEADQKRCMPLMNDDMCPIAIDVVPAPEPQAPAKEPEKAKEKKTEDDHHD